MTTNIKEIVYASMFLALCALTSMLQIPLPFIPGGFWSIEFSLVFLLISRIYIKFSYTLIITFIYPWFPLIFSTFPTEPVGQFMLFLQALFFIFIDWLFNRKNFYWWSAIINIFLTTLFSFFANMFIFYPLYGIKFWSNENSFEIIKIIFINSILFNPIKLTLIYLIYLPSFFVLKKVL